MWKMNMNVPRCYKSSVFRDEIVFTVYNMVKSELDTSAFYFHKNYLNQKNDGF